MAEDRTAQPREASRARSASVVPPLPGLDYRVMDEFGFAPPSSIAKSLEGELVSFAARPRLAIVAGAGTQAYPTTWLPGAYLTAGLQIGRGKWFVPLDLRYDYGRREFMVVDEAMAEFALDPGQVRTNYQAVRTAVYQQIIDRDLDRVTTHTLGLRTGIGLRAFPRWTVRGGVEASYLLGGRGPAIAANDRGNSLSLQLMQEQLNQRADPLFSGQVAADLETIDLSVHRMFFAGWLTVDLRLFEAVGVSAGISQQLRPVYRSEDVTTEGTRVELGGWVRF